MTQSQPLEIVLQKLTPAQQRVAASLLQGATVKEAAEENGLHRSTVHTWCRSNPTFQAALEEARRIQAAWLADELHTLVMEAQQLIRRILHNDRLPDSIRLTAALAIIDRATRSCQAAEPGAVSELKVRAIREMIREAENGKAKKTAQ